MKKVCVVLLVAASAFGTRTVHGQAGQVPDPQISGVETRLTFQPGSQYDPAISGNIVVFTSVDDVTSADVGYINLADPALTLHNITAADGDQYLTDVSNGRIVYSDFVTGDVNLYDVAAGTTTDITAADNAHSCFNPAISGSLVAWRDSRTGNQEIYAMDLATGEERRLTSSPAIDDLPAVGGRVVAWQQCLRGVCNVFAYDWDTQALTQVSPQGDARMPDVNGHYVVYQSTINGETDVALYDLATGSTRYLHRPGAQGNPNMSGEYVAFEDLSSGISHVMLWHLTTDHVFQVTGGTSMQFLNDIDGDRIVYTDDRNGDLDIYLFTFQPEVVSPAAQLAELAAAVESLNLKRGIENSLDAKLNAAVAALAAARTGAAGTACNQLGAFVNEVQAQSGKSITAADAAMLIELAQRIRTGLGCV